MIVLLGISYKTGPISVREKYSLSESEISQLYARLKPYKNFNGLAVINTCNRQELYLDSDLPTKEENFDFLTRELSKFIEYNPLHSQYFYFFTDGDVAEHLFKVVSGLESMVLGEDQIVMQVKNAYKFCNSNGFLSPVLSRLFNKSFEAGNRVRTETNIAHGAASISSAAVEICFSKFKNTTEKNILIIGAGQTGELCLTNFAKKQCHNITITNRTYEKAANIAEKFNVKAIKLKEIQQVINNFDIVLAATSSKNLIVTVNMIKPNGQKRIFEDLSVPRNIDEKISNIQGIELLAIDDLKNHINATEIKRHQAVDAAMKIIGEVKTDFSNWISSRSLSPVFNQIKNNFETVNSNELSGFLKINGIKNDSKISEYANHITEKFIRLMIKNVKNITDNGKRSEYLELIDKLFEF